MDPSFTTTHVLSATQVRSMPQYCKCVNQSQENNSVQFALLGGYSAAVVAANYFVCVLLRTEDAVTLQVCPFYFLFTHNENTFYTQLTLLVMSLAWGLFSHFLFSLENTNHGAFHLVKILLYAISPSFVFSDGYFNIISAHINQVK
jgi:hypothetical protein